MSMKNSLILTFLIVITFTRSIAQYSPIDPGPFQLGTDLSMVKAILDNGGVYAYENLPTDVFAIFKEGGYNYVRLRLFHAPNMVESIGTVNSLEYTLALASQVKAAGFKLLLDFHYSDTWADPGNQQVPAAWNSLSYSTLQDSLYQYTKRVLNIFAAKDLSPDMVQTGNEINNGFLWPHGQAWKSGKPNYNSFASLLKSAVKGVRESTGGSTIPVMIHAATGGSKNDSRIFLDSLLKYGLEFDVIGLSFYPCWHGTLADLEENIQFLNQQYSQAIMVVETSYQAEGTPPDYCVLTEEELPYPFSQQGQTDYLQTIYQILRPYEKVKGLYYWGGEYIWAGDIGGSWSSLFHWQGNAYQAITALAGFLPTSVNEPFSQKQIKVYVHDQSLEICWKSDNKPAVLAELYNLSGMLLLHEKIVNENHSMEIQTLNKGMYVLRILLEDGTSESQLLILH